MERCVALKWSSVHEFFANFDNCLQRPYEKWLITSHLFSCYCCHANVIMWLNVVYVGDQLSMLLFKTTPYTEEVWKAIIPGMRMKRISLVEEFNTNCGSFIKWSVRLSTDSGSFPNVQSLILSQYCLNKSPFSLKHSRPFSEVGAQHAFGQPRILRQGCRTHDVECPLKTEGYSQCARSLNLVVTWPFWIRSLISC